MKLIRKKLKSTRLGLIKNKIKKKLRYPFWDKSIYTVLSYWRADIFIKN